jgi:hypothetical protein
MYSVSIQEDKGGRNMANIYQYYTPYVSEEHMLYFGEIAQVFGILTSKGEPHNRFVAAAFRDYEKEIGQTLPQYYYMGNSLMRVYPKDQYVPAIARVMASLDNYEKKDGLFGYLDSTGKRHWFKLKYELRKAV